MADDDLHDLVKGITSALVGRLDDHDLLVKLNTRSEMTFQGVSELKTSIEAKQTNLDMRIRVLEQGYWKMIGAAAAVGAIASALMSLVKHA